MSPHGDPGGTLALHNEIEFETELCEHLAAYGWLYSPNDSGYDVGRALFPEDVFAWLEDTAPEDLAKVVKPTDNPTLQAKARLRILDRIVAKQASDPSHDGGTLAAVKKGFAATPSSFRMFQPQPADGLNPTTVERYAKNRLRVMRQCTTRSRAPSPSTSCSSSTASPWPRPS